MTWEGPKKNAVFINSLASGSPSSVSLAVWQAAAEAEGVSLNKFIQEAVEAKIKEKRGV